MQATTGVAIADFEHDGWMDLVTSILVRRGRPVALA